MEASSQPRAPWIQSLDRAGWSKISDRILHGLCHDLSGRVGSIAGLTYLMESQDGEASSVLSFLKEEVGQVESTIRLLRLLPDDATEPEILAPGELMEDLNLLVNAQRGLENVEVEMEGFSLAPAVRIDRTLFIRGLAVLLTAAAERVVVEGPGPVRVRAMGHEGRLVLEIRPVPGGASDREADPGILPTRVIQSGSLRFWEEGLTGAGLDVRGVAKEDGDGPVQLTFPSPSSFGSD